MSLINLKLHEAADKLAAGELTSRQLCEALLERVDAVEEKVGALVSINNSRILAAADAADARRAAGESIGRYDGLPITIKDNIVEEGEESKCASSIIDGLVNVYDSTVVRKLKEAGCVIFGRANMDEFAMGSTTETSQIKKTSNPHDLDCVPGGSSGGSAAGVASKEFLGALGSDTGGSIRQPASFCGIVGLKPAYGLVSRYGLVAFASSLDQIGPMSKDVRDSALILDIINGECDKDSTALPGKITDFESSLEEADVKGMKLGVPSEYFDVEGMEEDVKKSVQAAIAKLEEMGAEIVPVSLPHTKYAIPTYYVIATAEACTNLARFEGVRYGIAIKKQMIYLRCITRLVHGVSGRKFSVALCLVLMFYPLMKTINITIEHKKCVRLFVRILKRFLTNVTLLWRQYPLRLHSNLVKVQRIQ